MSDNNIVLVYSRQEVGFVMKCGLTFKEMI